MIRWGILGLGRIAHKFVQDLLTVEGAVLHAVAASDQTRADEFGAQYGATHCYGSYEQLLACPDLDVVYIASRHVYHRDHTLLLLNAGIPVLCEKPFGMDAGQVSDMVQTARSKGVFLMEALWSRFMPAILKAKEWVDAGTIGPVRMVKADFGFAANPDPAGRLFNKALGGGSLLDIGIYPLFLSYLMLGKPATIRAAATFGPTGVDEQCGMTLTYANGAMAVLDSTLLVKTDCVGLILGETGTIRIGGRFHESKTVTLEREGVEPETISFDRETFGYDYEIRHVMQCLRDGHTESNLWSLDNSLDLIGLMDAVGAEAGIRY
jgi:predicted dehydrogenase